VSRHSVIPHSKKFGNTPASLPNIFLKAAFRSGKRPFHHPGNENLHTNRQINRSLPADIPKSRKLYKFFISATPGLYQALLR